jgi:dipeptidyl aminopeptidase/acylaminoacyl peptidase
VETLLLIAMLAAAPQFIATVRDAYPVPSPDGTQVAFQSNRGGESALWMMRVDGTGLRKLDVPHADPSTPDFSPDGTRLVYAARSDDSMEGATGAVYVLELASGRVTRVRPALDSVTEYSAFRPVGAAVSQPPKYDRRSGLGRLETAPPSDLIHPRQVRDVTHSEFVWSFADVRLHWHVRNRSGACRFYREGRAEQA